MIKLFLWLSFLVILVATDDSLLLEAVLEPLNTTHLKASLWNNYTQSIYILGWNNHLQKSQNGAHGSFRVVQDGTGANEIVLPAPNRLNFQFLKPVANHFTKVNGKARHTAIIDITELFHIPRPGEYNVSMEFLTRAILETKNISEVEQIVIAERSAENLHKLVVTSHPITVWLSPSISHKTLRRRSSSGLCSDDHKIMPVVLRARENARNLAKYAQNANDPALWAEYFNNSAAELRVKRVYQGIINYGRNGNYYGINEYCDPINEDPECMDDEQILAYRNPYQVGTNTTTITLCAHFMHLQQQITCNYPSNSNPSMIDQGGLFLHELTHVKSLVGYADISDGIRADCYSWNCVQDAVTGDRDEIPPWHIGRAYELYAYAARALGTRSCNVNTALVENLQNQSLLSQPGNLQRMPSTVPTLTSLTQNASPTSSSSMLKSTLGESVPKRPNSKTTDYIEDGENISFRGKDPQDGDGDGGCLTC